MKRLALMFILMSMTLWIGSVAQASTPPTVAVYSKWKANVIWNPVVWTDLSSSDDVKKLGGGGYAYVTVSGSIPAYHCLSTYHPGFYTNCSQTSNIYYTGFSVSGNPVFSRTSYPSVFYNVWFRAGPGGAQSSAVYKYVYDHKSGSTYYPTYYYKVYTTWSNSGGFYYQQVTSCITGYSDDGPYYGSGLITDKLVATDGTYPDNGGGYEPPTSNGSYYGDTSVYDLYGKTPYWYVKTYVYKPGAQTPNITVVNGQPFSIVISDALGSFAGTVNTVYGSISGTNSTGFTTLNGTLTGVPSGFTQLLIGINNILIRGVSAPTTTVTTSFY